MRLNTRLYVSILSLFVLVRLGFTQDITIDSIRGNGSMSFWGATVGTTATVEWAASLTEAGRTNWHVLTNIVVTASVITNDIPMFFRVRGTPDTNLVNGLVAYFPFDGNANDVSGYGNNGTISNATLTVDRFGTADKAMFFNGTTAYIKVNDSQSIRPENAVSVAAWVRIDAVSANYTRIVTKGKNLGAAYSNWQLTTGTKPDLDDLSNKPLFTLWPSTRYDYPYPTHTLGLGVWHHVCGTWDGTTAKLYYDGTMEAQIAIGGSMVYDSSPLMIGKDNFYNNYFNGAIDEVRIYNRALSPEEVSRLTYLH